MDMQMPVMDGVEATRQIRSLPACSSLPIVAMTASAMRSDRERCLQAGMNDFVSKPIEPEELWGMLLRWITPLVARPDAAQPGQDGPAIQQLQASDNVSVDFPSTIDGLDMTSALRRVSGKQARYLSLLRGFCANHADAAQRIRAALQRGDAGTAERLAHTLRGLAGTIGATTLQQDCEQLERVIHLAQPSVEILHVVEMALRRQVAAIAAALPAEIEAQTVAAVPVDRVQLELICRQLGALLAGYEGEARKLLAQHAGLLAAAFPRHFRQLADAVQRFDYDKALEILTEATQV
jgi:CheY-like chemotaxis protein